MLSDSLRILVGPLGKTKTTLVFVNQLRSNIGKTYGSPDVQPGGRALKFYSSVRLDIRKKDFVKVGENIVGNDCLVKVVKNKVAPPFKEALVQIIFGRGLNKEFEIGSLAAEFGILEYAGAGWIKMDGETVCQGSNNLYKLLKENSDFRDTIEKRVIEKIEEEKEELNALV